MARVSKSVGTEVDFNKVREMVRKEIEKKYGGVAKFLNSEKGKEFGGMKIKVYLYNTGPINFNLISDLCKYLGIGDFTRKIVVSRTFSYRLRVNDSSTEKTA